MRTKRIILITIFLGMTAAMGPGCRIPLIDPPVIGEWDVRDEESMSMTFERDGSGVIRYVIDWGKADDGKATTVLTEAFTWRYDRKNKALSLSIKRLGIVIEENYNVSFNFFQTEMTLETANGSRKRELKLLSTPIFRL